MAGSAIARTHQVEMADDARNRPSFSRRPSKSGDDSAPSAEMAQRSACFRVRKAPKVYVRDSGLLHLLLGVVNRDDLDTHPKAGASWEGYAIEEILKAARPDEAYCWSTYQGAELDLLLFKDGRRF